MNNNKYVFIAAPFFNEEQLERVNFLQDFLRSNGYNFFSAKEEIVAEPFGSYEWRQKAFENDINGVKRCDFMIAITDGKDPGTFVEVGYAIAMGKPIFYFAETLGDKPFNLMLSQSSRGVFTDREQLLNYDFDNVSANMSFYNYKGAIE